MLRFESASKVGVSAVRAIVGEAAGVDRQWWHKPLSFENAAPQAPEYLKGGISLFRPGVPLEDDLFMAFGDMAAVVELLSGWAKAHGVKWHLFMNADDWGTIDPTGPSQVLLGQLKKWSKRAKVPDAGKGQWLIPDTRRRDISMKHPPKA
ncbi:MAG TPA: hypothetical protein VF950_27800 [Planctomycetota bacterium]